MKLKYFGTAAAEGIPALFCDCPVCRYAQKVKGKEIRTRAQALLDDKILLDFGPDTLEHFIKYDVKSQDLKYVVITHSHCDHYVFDELGYRRPGFAAGRKDHVLTVYATKPAYDEIKTLEDRWPDIYKAVEVRENEPFFIEDYEFFPVKANHDENAGSVIYFIDRNGKSMLYAHDTGVFTDGAKARAEALGKPLDYVSLDCTGALLSDWRRGHLSLDTAVETAEYLKSVGAVSEKTKLVISHFSHNGKGTHEDLCKAAKEYGIEVAFDGMEVEF